MHPFRLDKLFYGVYCNETMTEGQPSKFIKKEKLSPVARLIAGSVFCLIAAGAAILWASAMGYIRLGPWLGVCGFKRRFGLPCPGCGWTHAAQTFFTGHFGEAFYIQPAAGFFCVVLVFAAIFALHAAIFGINSRFLQCPLRSASGVRILLVTAAVVVMAGWAVTLIRSILENSGR